MIGPRCPMFIHSPVIMLRIAPVLLLVVSCGDLPSMETTEVAVIQQSVEGRSIAALVETTGQLHFESMRSTDGSRHSLVTREFGQMSIDEWQRVARPYSYVTGSEPSLFHEDAGGESRTGGSVDTWYRVLREPFDPAIRRPAVRQPVAVDPLLLQGSPMDQVTVHVLIRDIEDPNIPLVPPAELFDFGTREQARRDKADALDAYRAMVHDRSSGIRGWVSAVGGRVHAHQWLSGWLAVGIRRTHITTLALRDDVSRIIEPALGDSACNTSCTMEKAGEWKVGEGRSKDRLDVDRFIDAGYDADGFSAAVIEELMFEDEHQGFKDDDTPTFRISQRYDCSSGNCTAVSNLADSDSNSGHGTMVAGILLSDLEDDQAKTLEYGDACWDSTSHCSNWKLASSGMAPEANLYFYADTDADSGPVADAIDQAMSDDVDVVNLSLTTKGADCDPTSSRVDEDLAENALDLGIFLTAGTGNNNVGGSTSCDIGAPADTPKVFAVNAIRASNSSCEADYDDCPIDPDKHRLGGADLKVDGATKTSAMSGIDALAPNWVYYKSLPDGPSGEIGGTSQASGTSAAAPHVAGAALLVKDWFSGNGHGWIGSPGRLHTVMLAMTDRDEGSSFQTSRADPLWGLGKLKLRLFESGGGLEPFKWRMKTYTRTTPGTITYAAWTNKFSTGTDIVKCVLLEDEDMSGKSDVGDVFLFVQVKEPTGGGCTTMGSTVATKTDASWDIKHMTTITDSDIELDGRCLEVNIVVNHIAGSAITFHAFCYSAGELDHDPN
jgi:hypothetical protein